MLYFYYCKAAFFLVAALCDDSDEMIRIAKTYVKGASGYASYSPIKVFDYFAYDNWSRFSTTEKLEYLLDIREYSVLYDEFSRFKGDSAIDSETVSLIQIELVLEEFQSTNNIELFFNSCDANSDKSLVFSEYVVCRGDFDKNGNAADVNEYDARSSVLIRDHETFLASTPFHPGKYKYDENGIIIDE